MFVHIGGEYTILIDSIIGLVNLETVQASSSDMNDFLRQQEEENITSALETKENIILHEKLDKRLIAEAVPHLSDVVKAIRLSKKTLKKVSDNSITLELENKREIEKCYRYK